MQREKPSVLDAFNRITTNSDLTSVDLLTILRTLYKTGYLAGLKANHVKDKTQSTLPYLEQK